MNNKDELGPFGGQTNEERGAAADRAIAEREASKALTAPAEDKAVKGPKETK